MIWEEESRERRDGGNRRGERVRRRETCEKLLRREGHLLGMGVVQSSRREVKMRGGGGGGVFFNYLNSRRRIGGGNGNKQKFVIIWGEKKSLVSDSH